MIDPISGFIIEEETVKRSTSAHKSHKTPNPYSENLNMSAAHPCVDIVNSSDEEGPVTEEYDGVSKDKKRVWRDNDKQEWLKIYQTYTQERLKTLPQPLDIRGTLGKDIVVGRDGFKRAGRTKRKLKQGSLEDDTMKDTERDVSKCVKTTKVLKNAGGKAQSNSECLRVRKVLIVVPKRDSNNHLERCQAELTEEHIDVGNLERTRIENDMTEDQNERIGKDLHRDCERDSKEESHLVIDLDRNNTTSKTVKPLNLRYNSLKILKYSNICLFKWTKHYLVCYECGEWFKDMQTLRDHVKDSHTYDQIREKIGKAKDIFFNADITDLECNMCALELNSLSDLENHLITHNVKLKRGGSSLTPYKLCTDALICQLCGDGFTTRYKLLKHMVEHVNFPNSKPHGKTYGAHIKSANDSSGPTLKYGKPKERKIMSERDRFKCNQCSQRFRYDYKRTQHMIEDHKKESKLFQCEFCPKIFLTIHWLTKHMNCVHQKEMYTAI